MQNQNCQWLMYDRNTRVTSKNYDFIFNDLSLYRDCRQIQLPPLKGRWDIALVNLSEDEVTQLERMYQEEFNFLDIYVPKEILKRTDHLTSAKTNWNLFLDKLEAIGTPFDTDAMYELYYGCQASLDLIDMYIKKILAENPTRVTKKVVNKYVLNEFKVYPNDVLCSLFLFGSPTVNLPAESPLKRYLKAKCVNSLEHLVNVLGEVRAYYSVRKAVIKLYKLKLQYIKGTAVPKNSNRTLLELCKVVDIYSVLWAYIFVVSSTPKSVYSLLLINERGKYKDVSIYTEKFIADNIGHIYLTHS